MSGIEADLADMKRVGIAGVQMLDVSIYMPPGPVRYGSDRWHEHVQYAIETADRLGLEFMMMNSPGWSASGGPWVSPEQSMKKLVWSETDVPGERPLDLKVPLPITRLGVYHDVALLAVPADPIESNVLRSSLLKTAEAKGRGSIDAIHDGNRETSVALDDADTSPKLTIDFHFTQPVELSQLDLLLKELAGSVTIRGAIEVTSGEGFERVADFNFPDHLGAQIQFQVPFKLVRGTAARLTLQVTGTAQPVQCAIAEISLGHPPRIPYWTHKNKMAEKAIERIPADQPSPFLTIPFKQVHNLTEFLEIDGRVRCTLPPGRWTLIRFGYTSTGSMNHPAVPEGHGLEIDKLDREAVSFYFDHSLGRIIREAGPMVGKTFTGILFDSFEGGPQNWTATFPQQFSELKGYGLIPYLPAITGRIVESPATTEAFLHDFRTAVEELLARNYFGTMRQLAHKHGLSLYAEAQGGPLNPVSANEYTDVPMNEFWLPNTAPREARIKLVASTANLLGRKIVAAEAFTSTPENDSWRNSPATLKRAGDYAFTTGINRYILHYYAHQPVTQAAPGFTLGRYGTHFGRLNTWWPYAHAWFEYVARCQFLLQQGQTIADVCFLLNEDFGYGYPKSLVDTPSGYDFDICYPRHVMSMKCEDGAIAMPHERRYQLLVLPRKAWAADVETLKRIHELVKEGASVLGHPPVAPAGLSDHLHRMEEFTTLVSKLWGNLDGKHVKSTQLGQGMVMLGMSVADALQLQAVPKDVAWPERADDGEFRFIHRRCEEADFYFIFNHSAKDIRTTLTFRDQGRTPELWNPMTGTSVAAPVFTSEETSTTVPLNLEPYGSIFVVFRHELPKRWTEAVTVCGSNGQVSAPSLDLSVEMFDGLPVGNGDLIFQYSDGTEQRRTLPNVRRMEIAGPWQVAFQYRRGAPHQITLNDLMSWSLHPDPGVKYFSGIAKYYTHFTPTIDSESTDRVFILDLGNVADIAQVRLNGEEVGVAWQPPYRLDVTDLLREGPNELVISVANQWVNRMIGDEHVAVPYEYRENGSKFTNGALMELPSWLYDPERQAERKRISFSTWKHFSADSPLLESGLLGPVMLEQTSRIAP